jgi:hypothetical protein
MNCIEKVEQMANDIDIHETKIESLSCGLSRVEEQMSNDVARHQEHIDNLSHNLSRLYCKVDGLEKVLSANGCIDALELAEPKEKEPKPTLDSCIDRLRVLYTRMPRALALEMLNIIYDLEQT